MTLPSLSSFDAVVMDLDGTLLDTLGDFAAAVQGMLSAMELTGSMRPLSSAEIEPMVGKGSEHLIRSALAHVLQDHALQPRDASAELERLYAPAWQAYQACYARINGLNAQVYPGVDQALARLARLGLPAACLTNKPVGFARVLLERKGLLPAFAQVFGGDSFERKKPDPLPLLKTCEALGTLPHRTLMVGDSVNDALAARAAGCPVVLVSYGYNHGQPIRSVDADGYVDSLAELA